MTLVELMVAMVLMGTVFAIVLPFLTSGFVTLGRQQGRSETNDEVQLVLRRIERDVRSGNVIGSPGAVDGVPGMQVRLYTQTNGVPFRCVEYRVLGDRLERRERAPEEEWPETWETAGEGVRNATETPPVSIFTRSADRQTLTVSLVVQREDDTDGSVRVTSSITGRNTRSYDTPFASDTCA